FLSTLLCWAIALFLAMNVTSKFRPVRTLISLATGLSLSGLLTSCTTLLTNDYEATAVTTYTWHVEYVTDPNKVNGSRIEKFESTSLVNVNGIMPEQAVTGPDDQGLWWPALPPRPTVDELEAGQADSQETIGTPELNKSVDYSLTYQSEGQTITLPADYSVYRAAVRGHRDDRPLELTLGVNDGSVEKAEVR
ncbi:MAG: hypothetical protein VKL39_06570, partial [Leptolyngbyaceae bacterium]|nr:hypothetical protein [Leptolyngbyaceae bacterium]